MMSDDEDDDVIEVPEFLPVADNGSIHFTESYFISPSFAKNVCILKRSFDHELRIAKAEKAKDGKAFDNKDKQKVARDFLSRDYCQHFLKKFSQDSGEPRAPYYFTIGRDTVKKILLPFLHETYFIDNRQRGHAKYFHLLMLRWVLDTQPHTFLVNSSILDHERMLSLALYNQLSFRFQKQDANDMIGDLVGLAVAYLMALKSEANQSEEEEEEEEEDEKVAASTIARNKKEELREILEDFCHEIDADENFLATRSAERLADIVESELAKGELKKRLGQHVTFGAINLAGDLIGSGKKKLRYYKTHVPFDEKVRSDGDWKFLGDALRKQDVTTLRQLPADKDNFLQLRRLSMTLFLHLTLMKKKPLVALADPAVLSDPPSNKVDDIIRDFNAKFARVDQTTFRLVDKFVKAACHCLGSKPVIFKAGKPVVTNVNVDAFKSSLAELRSHLNTEGETGGGTSDEEDDDNGVGFDDYAVGQDNDAVRSSDANDGDETPFDEADNAPVFFHDDDPQPTPNTGDYDGQPQNVSGRPSGNAIDDDDLVDDENEVDPAPSREEGVVSEGANDDSGNGESERGGIESREASVNPPSVFEMEDEESVIVLDSDSCDDDKDHRIATLEQELAKCKQELAAVTMDCSKLACEKEQLQSKLGDAYTRGEVAGVGLEDMGNGDSSLTVLTTLKAFDLQIKALQRQRAKLLAYVKCQSFVRCYLFRRRYLQLRQSAVLIQTHVRTRHARKLKQAACARRKDPVDVAKVADAGAATDGGAATRAKKSDESAARRKEESVSAETSGKVSHARVRPQPWQDPTTDDEEETQSKRLGRANSSHVTVAAAKSGHTQRSFKNTAQGAACKKLQGRESEGEGKVGAEDKMGKKDCSERVRPLNTKDKQSGGTTKVGAGVLDVEPALKDSGKAEKEAWTPAQLGKKGKVVGAGKENVPISVERRFALPTEDLSPLSSERLHATALRNHQVAQRQRPAVEGIAVEHPKETIPFETESASAHSATADLQHEQSGTARDAQESEISTDEDDYGSTLGFSSSFRALREEKWKGFHAILK